MYDIIWMETSAWMGEGTLGKDLAYGDSTAVEVTSWWEQGNEPSEVQVYDDNKFFPRALKGSKVKLNRNDIRPGQDQYEIALAQQLVLYGVALIQTQDQGNQVVYEYDIQWIHGSTFSPFNQEPDPVPTKATNYFEYKDLKYGTKVYVFWHEPIAKWVILSPANADPYQIIQFKLTEDLAPKGTANAKRVEWNGANYAEKEAIKIADWYPTRGMWRARKDAMGVAMRRRSDSSSSNNIYDIIWMETVGWVLEGPLTQKLDSSGVGNVADGAGEFYNQGNIPTKTVQVTDLYEFFPHTADQSQVKALRDEYGSTTNTEAYGIVNAQQMVLYGEASAVSEFCGDSSVVYITWTRGYSFSPFNQEPDPVPTEANNPFGLAGLAGDKLFVVYSEPDASWVVVQVQHHVHQVISDLKLVGYTIQKLQGNVYVMKCSEPSWVDWITGVSCSSS